MYVFGFKWFKKPLRVINIKFYDVIVIDMFHKYRIRSLKEFCKNGTIDSFAIPTRNRRNLLIENQQDTG